MPRLTWFRCTIWSSRSRKTLALVKQKSKTWRWSSTTSAIRPSTSPMTRGRTCLSRITLTTTTLAVPKPFLFTRLMCWRRKWRRFWVKMNFKLPTWSSGNSVLLELCLTSMLIKLVLTFIWSLMPCRHLRKNFKIPNIKKLILKDNRRMNMNWKKWTTCFKRNSQS